MISFDQITIIIMGGTIYSLVWLNNKHVKTMRLHQNEVMERLNIILRFLNDIQIETELSSISPSHEFEENDVHGEESPMLRFRRIRD